jgi:hypothetical protein
MTPPEEAFDPMQSFYRARRDRSRHLSAYRIAGGFLRLAATGFGALSVFVFAFIFLQPLAFLVVPLGGLAAWRLTTWMTRDFVASEVTVTDEKASDRTSTVLMYLGTGLMAAGILAPVLALPWLFGCTDECQGFGVSIVFGGLLAFIGASTLFFVADDATIGVSRRPWRTLLSQGWPLNPVHRLALSAIGLAVGLTLALIGLPLHYIPPVALLVTYAATCLRGWARLDDSSQRDLWTDDRVLTQDFSFAIVTLWISIGVALLFIAIGWEGLSARL